MPRALQLISFVVQPGKENEIEVPFTLRLTQVSLADPVDNKGRSSLKLTYFDRIADPADDEGDEDEQEEFVGKKTSVVLANLLPGFVETQLLNGLVIQEGETITLTATGKNTLHVAANFIEQDDFDEPPDDDELDEEDLEFDDEEIENMTPAERNEFLKSMSRMGIEDEEIKAANAPKKAVEPPVSKADVASKKRRASDAEPAISDKRDISSGKKAKGPDGKPVAAAASSATEKAAKTASSEKAKAGDQVERKAKVEVKGADKPKGKKDANSSSSAAAKAAKSTTTAGGVKITDAKTGEGQSTKKGNFLQMRYILKLANGKVIDKNTSGKPFGFKLGAGEVIKGWDEGLVGMKVGGERSLEVPPHMGYGKRNQRDIPANSTLFFEVKLLAIK